MKLASMRTAFVKTLEKLADKDSSIFLLTADLGFKLFDDFRRRFPDRFINVGVAEGNMIGVAAGMALSDKNVYCYSMVPFLTMRALEQIRVDICYHNLPVKLIGVGGGLAYGLEGMTHHGIEDLAVMRSLPNMTVVAPGDPLECEAAVRESRTYSGPLYIRLGGNNDPAIHDGNIEFKIGQGIVVKEGKDVSIFATGTMLPVASKVVDLLGERGYQSNLVSIHTIKPLDIKLVREVANRSKAVFTIEEHSKIGGLGSAVAEALIEGGWKGIFKRFALPDKYGGHIGKTEYLREKHGLSCWKIYGDILLQMER